MKNKLYQLIGLISLFCLFSCLLFSANTPTTITMSSSTNNATAFGGDGTVGTATTTFYVHWDNTYLYLGWSGGNTNYSSDMYYAAIDTDPTGGNGNSAAIEGVDFDETRMDYYVVYENNSLFYGVPTSNGNAFEIYENSGGSWNFVSRTGGDNGTSSQIDFSNHEVRLRIAWSTLNFTRGSSTPLGIVMWTNNNAGNNMWSRFPTENPGTGSTPKTLTHQMIFSDTGDGVTPSSGFSSTALPVDLVDFEGRERNEEVLLNWTTAFETENKGFEIQHSLDGYYWDNIGFVPGQDYAFELLDYQFVDGNPAIGNNYYRLKQIDFDGKNNYSKVIRVNFNKKTDFQLFPNPVADYLNIRLEHELEEDLMVKIVGIEGRTLQLIRVEPYQTEFKFDVFELQKGLYFLELKSENGVVLAIEKFTKN